MAKAVPAQRVTTAVGVTDFQKATVRVVAVMGFVAVRIDLDGDVTLTIAIVFPSRIATFDAYQLAVEIAVIGWKSFRGDEGDQASGVVVAVFSDGVECIFFCNQTPLFVVDFLCFCAIRIGLADQPGVGVMHVNLFAAVGIDDRGCAVVIPDVAYVHLRVVGPLAHATRSLAFAFPFPVEAGTTGQLPFENDVLIVVAIVLAFTRCVCGAYQLMVLVVVIGDQGLYGQPRILPLALLIIFRTLLLVVDRGDVAVVVTQQQRASCAVVDTLDAVNQVVLDM